MSVYWYQGLKRSRWLNTVRAVQLRHTIAPSRFPSASEGNRTPSFS